MADPNPVQEGLLKRYLGVLPRTHEDLVLRLVIETGVRAVGGEEGSLLVFDPEANDLTFVMTYGGSESALVGQRVPMGSSLVGLAAETGQVQIGAPRYRDAARTEALEGVQAVIAAPMKVRDKLIGVITAISNKADKRFTMEDAELYACLATIAALVVDQSLALRAATDEPGADFAAASVSGDPLEQEVLGRIGRLLQRDRNTVRQVARMLEAMEGMSGLGPSQ